MQMERLKVWGVFSLMVLTAAQSTTHSPDPRPSYLLLAPRALRPGVPTSVSVTVLTSSSVSVSVHIVHDKQRVASNSSTVGGGSTELLTLPPIHESESSYLHPYMLEVKGHVGSVEVFSNSTRLDVDPRGLSTFIQTDKLNYRPGQAVKIRAVSVHPDGKPFVSPVDIIIRDPRGNLLRQWLSLDSVLGVVSKEFQLSENPPLGKWTIVITVSGVSSVKHFNVVYYVLPKFEVVIEAPDVLHREDTLSGSVTAKYLYGKPVQGHVKITFLHRFHGFEDAYDEEREIDGSADFEFDIPDSHTRSKRALFFYDGLTREELLTIVVQVTEHLTGLTYNSTATVSLAKHRYKLSFEGYSPILRPSLKFTARLKISTYNDQPLSVEDQLKTVQVSVMQQQKSLWSWTMDEEEEALALWSNTSGPAGNERRHPDEMLPEELEFPVPANGVVPLYVQLMNETETLTIDASFEDSYNSLQLYRRYTSRSHSYLQIQKPSTPAEVGSPLRLHIQRNFPETEIHYMVKSRGQVVCAGESSGDLTLVPQATWAPVACVIVYSVRPDGEVVNDVAQLPVTYTFQNQVTLSWSDTFRRPADEVTVKVTVEEPGSLVWILVVDKATRWAGSHNDITKETVLDQMREDGASKADANMLRKGDPDSVFKSCDLVALTDASLHTTENLLKPEILEAGGAPLLFQTDGPHVEQQQEPRERRNFPETWIWMETNTGDSNTAEITVTVPDSITTWTASAFAMSESRGLAVTEAPAQLTVFQEFFLSLNLPAFIIRGEELLLEVILFNYLPEDMEVMVIVAESDAFEFVFPDSGGLSMPSVRKLSVGSQSGASVLIPIRPLVLGETPVSVKAVSPAGSDIVRRTFLVKAEGLEQSFSASLLFEGFSSPSSLSRNVMFTFPADVVEGSERASVTAVGDIIGPSISGLDSLIQMPRGCGEQNMINFAPNIYVLQYLNATGQVEQDAAHRATAYMMEGYERELSYQRADGSFSAFGEQDASGSTWLSAFVLRCFLQARPFISIDAHVMLGAAAWLGAQQGADGRFEEPGRVIHTELQGGLDGPVSLTAYVLIALLEDEDIKAQYWSQASAALMFLETRLALGVSSNYSLSLLTFALTLAGSSSADAALSELIGRAEMKDGVPMWSSPDGGLASSWQPRSADIEMASYVLLSLLGLGRVTDGLGLNKWLSQQRNHNGGFGSTQDTVVGLQALSSFAALGRSHDFDLLITVSAVNSTTVASFHIHQDNYLLHQSRQIEPQQELKLQVSAEGRGLGLFQLNVFYNTRSEELMRRRRRRRRRRDAGEHEAFHLDVELFEAEVNSAHLYVCSSLSESLRLNETGMVILEAGLLSGFSLAPLGLQTDDVVKKVEAPAGKVVLYLDSVTKEEMCVLIPLIVEHKVAKVQEASVLIYDYYEPRRRTARTYRSERRAAMSTCSFCGEDCSQCRVTHQYELNAAAPGGRNLLLSSSHLLLIFIIFIFSV